ncbi:chemosensory receptor a [Plakobranchus ocellatus]|uniref:Chemosensory receptor a n=1 Tax=Plakobranchus ocellatus TaxID=259542 RepID=A0AAV3ZBX2_9GAST|nr:chemosensory receptor a [Plakobranchus ocellatus]
MNTSVAIDRDTKLLNAIKPILSAEVYAGLANFVIYSLLVVGTIGIVANILVIITCAKIGFSETINISYLTLGISDLILSAIRTYGALLFVFDMTKTDVNFDPTSVSVTTVFYPGQGFEKTTAFITAFIALERCLCVQFPLHVKRYVTKRKTILYFVVIFLVAFGPSNLSFLVFPFKWVFIPEQNRTILTVVSVQTSYRYIVSRALYAYYGTILHFTALIIVWICTILLAIGMKRKIDSRKETFKHSNAKEDRQKDRRVIKTVFLIAVTYLACSIPTAATLLVPHFVPEFAASRGLARLSNVCHIFSALLTQFNSTANIIIFIYMGSKFREAFLSLFGKHSSI